MPAPEPEEASESPVGFAPVDLTDGRKPGHWKTRWDSEARKQISHEALYLSLLLASLPVGTVGVWLEWPKPLLRGIHESQYATFSLHAYVCLGGMLGGTLFDIKWLYHSVAHGSWNRDRRLWRLMTPVIAGGLAFGMMLLGTAGIIPLLDTDALREPETAMGLSFLIGYFSDNAIGAMARVANSVLGEREATKSHHSPDKQARN